MALTALVVSLSQEQKDRLLKAVKEMSNSLARAEGEREYVSEATKKISDDVKLSKKLVSKLVKTFHKQNFEEEVAINNEFEDLYKSLVK
jgi:dihydrodipicolinate synthase/N-acetylneuraminate lyase